MRFANGIRLCFRSEEFFPSVARLFVPVFASALIAAEAGVYAMGEMSLRTGTLDLPVAVALLCVVLLSLLSRMHGFQLSDGGIRTRGVFESQRIVPWNDVDTVRFQTVCGLPFLRVEYHIGAERRSLSLAACVNRADRLQELVSIFWTGETETLPTNRRAA